MGLLSQMLRFLIDEHKRRPIIGEGLFVGRQATTLTPHGLTELLNEEGAYRGHTGFLYDQVTRHASGNTVTDMSAMNSFCLAKWKALDVSDYEGADIVHDLNLPLPGHLRGAFDFVFNGSCLDNIFDPAAALTNTCDLLRAKGRIVGVEDGSDYNGPYLKFTAEWFHDYFAENGWDVRVYHVWFDSLHSPFDLYEWVPGRGHQGRMPVPHAGDYMVVYCATRGEYSTTHKRPIQAQYRGGVIPPPSQLRFVRRLMPK